VIEEGKERQPPNQAIEVIWYKVRRLKGRMRSKNKLMGVDKCWLGGSSRFESCYFSEGLKLPSVFIKSQTDKFTPGCGWQEDSFHTWGFYKLCPTTVYKVIYIYLGNVNIGVL
jgi:hypothetical protein